MSATDMLALADACDAEFISHAKQAVSSIAHVYKREHAAWAANLATISMHLRSLATQGETG